MRCRYNRYKLIVVLAVVVLGMLVQGGCELFKVRDIEGVWTVVKVVNGVETTLTVEFVGSRNQGNAYVDDRSFGSYIVEYDTDLTFVIAYFDAGSTATSRKDTFTGGFDGKDTMSGSVEEVDGNLATYGVGQAGRQTEF